MLHLLAALCFALLCVWLANGQARYWASRGVEHVTCLQFIRDTVRMYYTPLHIIWQEVYKQHGPITGTFTMATPTLMVADPVLLKDIMVKNFGSFPNTEFIRQVGDPVLDNMLVSLLNKEWHVTRNIVSPVFSTSKMKQMVVTVNECAKDMVRNFADAAREGKPYDVKLIFGAFGLDVTAQTTFSFRLDSHRDVHNPFVLQAKRFFAAEYNWRAFLSFQFPRLSALAGLRIFCPDAVEYFSGVMTDLLRRRATNDKNDKLDFVRLLMNAECQNEEGSPQKDTGKRVLTRDQVLAQAVLFFVAGYDTTTIAMSMAVYYLARNKEIQARLIDEIEGVLQKHTEITYEVVMGLEYLDAVFMEVLRMNPSVHMTYRTCVRSTVVGKIAIDEGTLIRIPIFAIQHDEKYFPDPEVFDPERFLGKNKERVVPFTFLPFGEGPRQCVGMKFASMNIKLGLFHVLSRFSFETSSETQIPPKYQPSILLLLPYDVKLRVIDRKSQ
ncbi:cytochrome P450 3A9-like [Dermacentor variabilis]|uniref:cytochrome P450 3A9-like n=1 Tax=Dermacentor variabilis TaxID=34621 RepID=UPI003F5BE1D3